MKVTRTLNIAMIASSEGGYCTNYEQKDTDREK